VAAERESAFLERLSPSAAGFCSGARPLPGPPGVRPVRRHAITAGYGAALGPGTGRRAFGPGRWAAAVPPAGRTDGKPVPRSPESATGQAGTTQPGRSFTIRHVPPPPVVRGRVPAGRTRAPRGGTGTRM